MQNKGIYALIYDFLYIIWQFCFFFTFAVIML